MSSNQNCFNCTGDSFSIKDKGSTLHKMVRLHFKRTKENFENHAVRVGRYILLRCRSFSYFFPSTIALIVRLNNSLMTIVIVFIYV